MKVGGGWGWVGVIGGKLEREGVGGGGGEEGKALGVGKGGEE